MANLKLQVSRAAVVTPSDTTNIPYPGDATASPNKAKWPCVLRVNDASSGNELKIMTADGDVVILKNIKAGEYIPIQVIRVFATDTTVDEVVALW
jgi:hypothetical protein